MTRAQGTRHLNISGDSSLLGDRKVHAVHAGLNVLPDSHIMKLQFPGRPSGRRCATIRRHRGGLRVKLGKLYLLHSRVPCLARSSSASPRTFGRMTGDLHQLSAVARESIDESSCRDTYVS